LARAAPAPPRKHKVTLTIVPSPTAPGTS
jgi:hypothetical protein